MEQSKNKFPSEIVDLPSKGILYDKGSPLSSGKVEMKYMTAKEEDILTNQNYIEKGVVIDKLLQSLIVNKDINYNDLLVGDKNALLIAARVLGYGKEYKFTIKGEEVTVDLSILENKGDGNCLFLAIEQLDKTYNHTILRKNVCKKWSEIKTKNTIIVFLAFYKEELWLFIMFL